MRAIPPGPIPQLVDVRHPTQRMSVGEQYFAVALVHCVSEVQPATHVFVPVSQTIVPPSLGQFALVVHCTHAPAEEQT
jgi:hypothetical protein